MSNKKIRSEYIKNLMADKDNLAETIKESTKESLKSIVDESIKKDLRNLLSEDKDENSYEEEEVDSQNLIDTETDDEESTDKEGDVEVENDAEELDDDAEIDSDEDSESDTDTEIEDTSDTDAESSEEDTDGEDVWNDLEQYKGEDGEYDLTNMGKDDVIKVLKVMKPTDGVRVVKNDNGSVTLTDDETEKEYIIDIDGSFEDNEENEVSEDFEHADETDDVKEGCSEECEGDCDDDCEFEIETEVEESTTVGNGAQANSTAKSHATNNMTRPVPRNGSVAGEHVKGTGTARYSEAQMENIMRKANAIFTENKQLKDIAKQISEKLTEATVINHSLGKIIKIVTENTTTRDEKIDIVKRFNDVKTIDESTQLYNTIDHELKSVNKINSPIDKDNVQLAESKNNIVETSIYKSDDLTQTLSLMERLEKL